MIGNLLVGPLAVVAVYYLGLVAGYYLGRASVKEYGGKVTIEKIQAEDLPVLFPLTERQMAEFIKPNKVKEVLKERGTATLDEVID